MSNYVHITDGVIDEGPGGLPKAWKNVSGLNLNTDVELKDKGWLPVEEIVPPYDNILAYRVGYNIDIQADKVVYTANIVNFTQVELDQNTMNNWTSMMVRMDQFDNGGIPRLVEDMYDAMPPAQQDNVNQASKDKIAAKKLLRSQRQG
tara:strand:+ start:317 stop:760 length:444 start_codon:yes stop_codon:yes gene_type:complete